MKKILSSRKFTKDYVLSFPSIRIVKAETRDLRLLRDKMPKNVTKPDNDQIMGSYLEVPERRESF